MRSEAPIKIAVNVQSCCLHTSISHEILRAIEKLLGFELGAEDNSFAHSQQSLSELHSIRPRAVPGHSLYLFERV